MATAGNKDAIYYMDKEQAAEFLCGIEEGVYQGQNMHMAEEFAKRVSEPYMAKLDEFWAGLISGPGVSVLSKGLRGLDVYGQLTMAFIKWLGEGEAITAGVELAIFSRMDELEKFFAGKLAEWDAKQGS